MAINYFEDKENVFEITNSHLDQLKVVQKAYGIDDEARTLAFLLAVGREAEGSPIQIHGKIIQPLKKNKKE